MKAVMASIRPTWCEDILLADFGLARPPQSWQYVEEAEIRE